MIWLAYIGGTVAILLNSSLIDGAFLARSSRGWEHSVKFLVLFWPMAASVILLPGFRHVLRIPADLGANWIFRITESEGRRAWMRGVERFVIAYAIAPIYIVLAPVAFWGWGWPTATRLLVLEVLASLALFEMLFYSWQQHPFTCSYLPGQRPMVSILSGYIIVLTVLVPIVSYIIATACQFTPLFVVWVIILGGLWLKAHHMRRDGWGEAKILYEDVPSVVADLGIKEMTHTRTVLAR